MVGVVWTGIIDCSALLVPSDRSVIDFYRAWTGLQRSLRQSSSTELRLNLVIMQNDHSMHTNA